jgi:hypothetical protein
VLDPDVELRSDINQAAVARRSRCGRRGGDEFTVARARIVGIDVLANPARLRRLGRAV